MFKHLMIVATLSTSCAFAQNAALDEQRNIVIRTGDGGAFGQVGGITTAMAAPMATIAGAPYSAQTTTQRIQVLADGNRIERDTSGSVARDSQGRVRREESLPLPGANTGEAPHIVMIDDPVNQVHWTLDEQRKLAMKMPFPSGKNGIFRAAFPVPANADNTILANADNTIFLNSGAYKEKMRALTGDSNEPNRVKTDLGTQTIEGVPAQGTRITRTIPAGQIGNDQPIVITTETWYSPDLKVLVMSKSSDPRMGDTIYQLTNIQRSEPAATLFQPPDDYAVKEPPDGHTMRDQTEGPVIRIAPKAP
ncbi:MAG TPA: hypothetical protein VH325_06785 [Bryobacteraceae bacterium]|jgi:hypothetical protein|nr:hypothetical protein [Bryobacteraceae bacterium]